jgi:hypothetical protein
VERGEADLLRLADVLRTEEVLTTVEPSQRVFTSVKGGADSL